MQTKCEIRDETVYLDFDDYVSTVTTTRTPDVPSGSVFSVKTRTCLMWAGPNSTRIIVTTTVEWTGRSFIKAVIERSALEGQKVHHQDLERHMKQYISNHLSEFLPEGATEGAVAEEAAATLVESPTQVQTGKGANVEQRTTDQRGLQWALDTFTGAYKVGKQSASGAIELLKDAWDSASSASLLYIVVLVLILSNIYTYLMAGRREEVGRRKAETRKSEEREQWIGDTVRVLLQEFREAPGYMPVSPSASPVDIPQPSTTDVVSDHKGELLHIQSELDSLEARITSLRESLKHDLD